MKDNQYDRKGGPRGRKNDGPRINDEIRLNECRLLGDDGEAYGVVSMSEARRIAAEQGLDLVEVSPTASPPVVKIIDYGKFKYTQQKKLQEAKKKQIQVQLKEIQFRPNIETHDLETKLKKICEFLEDGDKVKLQMQFRGREMAYRENAMPKFENVVNRAVEYGAILESEPKFMGNRLIAMIAPDKARLAKRVKDREAAEKQAKSK
ncbi:MAG: translation initiation factor IF-3 [Bdellovibrio sp. CG12_big_fil_rev_8_21_14_0_65_39_13]|nr:MAG: translation initiation factor IF-3 [Bdellovibrio sp. CG22_combo_CG10-13_8_21_14_all_39_27]PIQ61607.1 MAG: translation initiation factor IF-3 [Bdellovibrio sp. CG12_big_fil_rev_8_21_14_0_65_39_13]PIR36039.1 MAG: translation initiation factor IF-3 [Bdellovibrio sp. CG11_big_fil_rev_8_21_14_0_20_39_38]PJB53542.1 MAG: translation initiation factor IF-3 [Bdellovibrio sp. CG_4_9_14_3_um_filter_39_7]